MINNKIDKINFYFFNIGLFFFLFLWDLKFYLIELRFIILIPLLFLIIDIKNYKSIKNLKILIIPLIILFHYLIVSHLNNHILDKRELFSILLFLFIFLLTTYNYKNFKKSLEIIIDIFTISFSLLFVLYFIYSDSEILLDCYDGWFFRTKFIFMENSHFALISIPIINFYTFVFCKIKKFSKIDYVRFLFFIIFLIISYINFSTTFLVGLILTQLYILLKNYKNKKIFVISIIYILICIFTLQNYKQCSLRSYNSVKQITDLFHLKYLIRNENLEKRNELLKQNQNKINMSMSVETFLVSLEITSNSLIKYPLGVGFNNYHLSHKEFINKIPKLDVSIKKNNIYDGSTNISKLITEFGIFGVILILFFIFRCLSKKEINEHDIFIISLLSLQFLRGVGYFNAGFVLFLIIFFIITNRNNNNFFKHLKI